MGIIKTGSTARDKGTKGPFVISRKEDDEEIPFVPAYDLLEAQEKRLSNETMAAIALALYLQTPDPSEPLSRWKMAARINSISRRF